MLNGLSVHVEPAIKLPYLQAAMLKSSIRKVHVKKGDDGTSRVNGVRCFEAAAEMICVTQPFPSPRCVSTLLSVPRPILTYVENCGEKNQYNIIKITWILYTHCDPSRIRAPG